MLVQTKIKQYLMPELLIDFILGSCWVWVKLVMLLKPERKEREIMDFISGSCR